MSPLLSEIIYDFETFLSKKGNSQYLRQERRNFDRSGHDKKPKLNQRHYYNIIFYFISFAHNMIKNREKKKY